MSIPTQSDMSTDKKIEQVLAFALKDSEQPEQFKKVLTEEERNESDEKSDELELERDVIYWAHLIVNHTPKGFKEHGYFSLPNKPCKISVYLGTNANEPYWALDNDCPNEFCSCSIQLSNIADCVEIENLVVILTSIKHLGYTFSGWNTNEGDKQDSSAWCNCTDKTETDITVYTLE